jgi:hypothetical protein
LTKGEVLQNFQGLQFSASARISKGQGISRLLKEKGREQFWQKKGQFASYKEKLEKWIEFHSFLGQ